MTVGNIQKLPCWKYHLPLFLVISLLKTLCLLKSLYTSCLPNWSASVLVCCPSLPQLCRAFGYTSGQSISDHPLCICTPPAHSSPNTETKGIRKLLRVNFEEVERKAGVKDDSAILVHDSPPSNLIYITEKSLVFKPL